MFLITGIYVIRNLVNGKVYIGQSVNVDDRLAHHKSELRHNRHTNTYMQRAWNKHGEDNFTFEVLLPCEEKYLDVFEKYFIFSYDAMNRKHGYNRESGGSLLKHISKESRAKMSASKTGVYNGDKNPMYGVHLKLSEERKRHLSESMSGSGNPMYGVHLSLTEERKQQMSENMKGEKNPFYGCKHTEETKQRMREKQHLAKPVICVETGVVYRSACEAERQTGIGCSNINKCCAGKQHTAGNYHWRYAT